MEKITLTKPFKLENGKEITELALNGSPPRVRGTAFPL